jgi:hypothetical protein
VRLSEVGAPVADAFYDQVGERLEAVIGELSLKDRDRFAELSTRIVLAENVPDVYMDISGLKECQPAVRRSSLNPPRASDAGRRRRFGCLVPLDRSTIPDQQSSNGRRTTKDLTVRDLRS